MVSKYANLLNDGAVRRWFENLKSRSIITSTVYLRNLDLYCELNQTSPKEILEVVVTGNFRDDFTDFVRKLAGSCCRNQLILLILPISASR